MFLRRWNCTTELRWNCTTAGCDQTPCVPKHMPRQNYPLHLPRRHFQMWKTLAFQTYWHKYQKPQLIHRQWRFENDLMPFTKPVAVNSLLPLPRSEWSHTLSTSVNNHNFSAIFHRRCSLDITMLIKNSCVAYAIYCKHKGKFHTQADNSTAIIDSRLCLRSHILMNLNNHSSCVTYNWQTSLKYNVVLDSGPLSSML